MSGNSLAESFEACKEEWNSLRHQMIALQEDLDWECYRLYSLLTKDLCCRSDPPRIKTGQRAFEIVLARAVAAGEEQTTWFERHSSTPTITPAKKILL